MSWNLQIKDFFKQAKKKKILVVGDLMLDQYFFGKSDRMSPEAPVPVVDVERQENRAGGAANVALNLKAFGCKVSLAGIVGKDGEGKILKKLLSSASIRKNCLLTSRKNPTTVKTRVIVDGKHVLRLDQEKKEWVAEDEKKLLSDLIEKEIENCDAIVIEDYDKGVLDGNLISLIIRKANEKSIPVVVDPKFRNFFSFANCNLFKPNLKELNEALHKQHQNHELDAIKISLEKLRKKMPHSSTCLTLGENGILCMDEDGHFFHSPSISISVKDVSGAGDAVAAILGLGLAEKISMPDLAKLANLAGGLACEEVGVTPVARAKIIEKWPHF